MIVTILLFFPSLAFVLATRYWEFSEVAYFVFTICTILYFHLLTIYSAFSFFLTRDAITAKNLHTKILQFIRSNFIIFLAFLVYGSCYSFVYTHKDPILFFIALVGVLVGLGLKGTFLGLCCGVAFGKLTSVLKNWVKDGFITEILGIAILISIFFEKWDFHPFWILSFFGLFSILISLYYWRSILVPLRNDKYRTLVLELEAWRASHLFAKAQTLMSPANIQFLNPAQEQEMYTSMVEHENHLYWIGILLRPSGTGSVYFQIHDLSYFCLPDTMIPKELFTLGYTKAGISSPVRRSWTRHLGDLKVKRSSFYKLAQMVIKEVETLHPWEPKLWDAIIEQLDSQSRFYRIGVFQFLCIHVDPWDRILQITQGMENFLGVSKLSRQDYLFKKISSLKLPVEPPDILEQIVVEANKNKKEARRLVTFSKEESQKQTIQITCSSGDRKEILVQDVSDLEYRKEALQKVLPPTVTQLVLSNKQDSWMTNNGSSASVSIIFADLRGFTTLSDQVTPEILIRTLNTFFPPLIERAFHYGATVNQIVGDEIMIIVGAPQSQKNHLENALNLALDINTIHQQTVARIKQEPWFPPGVSAPLFGLGINTGDVVTGFLGSEKFTYYTAVGKNVNMAHRICEIAPGGHVYVSQYCKEKLPKEAEGKFVFQMVEERNFKGFSKPIAVYEVLKQKPLEEKEQKGQDWEQKTSEEKEHNTSEKKELEQKEHNTLEQKTLEPKKLEQKQE